MERMNKSANCPTENIHTDFDFYQRRVPDPSMNGLNRAGISQ
jgi:hypothetical protein